MKKHITPLFLLISVFIYSQNKPDLIDLTITGNQISKNSNPNQISKKWFSNVEAEFAINHEVRYDYALYDNNDRLISGKTAKLDNKTSFGILYNINYPLLNKLTLGAVSGFQYQSQLKISTLKLGGILRYHFLNYESVNINLMTAYNMALSNNIESDMANVRLGLQFPIKRTDDFIINLNIFGDYNYYVYQEIILNDINERPGSLIFRSYGFSLGIQF
ncbi:hypothetical protein [Pseudotamlana carrageenivorans]|uniref:Outer membrane protein beta-barrel domain-containing protein n=1 Tax=Pseudotamlana carrageenivorans TaxID=2069432 RepID=A0A2I7SJJ1_9FLAO|nr:hypothetical protein [Tamlana carrageenivorans]AUS06076.1 hypothetical protein C1A40_11705 [Tamlana carrageenivorans]